MLNTTMQMGKLNKSIKKRKRKRKQNKMTPQSLLNVKVSVIITYHLTVHCSCDYIHIQILLTGYIGLISRCTAVVTASRSTFKGTLRSL